MGFFSNEEFIRYKKCTQPVYQTPASIQQMLDIAGVHENGIFEIEPNNGAGKKRRKFDRVYSFSDLNYVDQDKQQKDGGIRLRPVGTRKHRQNAPAYSPAGTGCPAFEQAVENLYKGQNEESFWTLMGALNYALEMETHVLVPLRTALTVHNTPAPWTEHPVPTAKAKDLQLWTLRNEKGRTWLPMFTSAAAACADRSTSARPMADYTLQDAMELALSTEEIDGCDGVSAG